ncbi:translin isoform X1 [Hyla sarda]|uniref:translin isoform X1 n=1 Tax=Hyla sarda TaxID=327740 RepID=UPI0024C2C2BA|nr:translin isoform X1 [Hyla sarda]
MSVVDQFMELQGGLSADQDVREDIRKVVQTLEQEAREILILLHSVHHDTGLNSIPEKSANVPEHFPAVQSELAAPRSKATFSEKCAKVREHFPTIRAQMATLATKFPADQYYRYHDQWRFVLQRLVFQAAFLVYLEKEQLVTRDAVAEILGIESEREKGFHLDIEDYLSGVLNLASELSRLAVNSVTAGDYTRPLRISAFINELDFGFRLLNLKNDSLRKRYDGLKYDVKKIEEVVYDLSIRGLSKGQSSEKS